MATIYTESESVMSSQLLSDVQLYRMSMPDHECPWGLKAIELMQKRQIHFEDHRLTSQEQVDAFKQRYGVPTTPQIFSGTERIGGYSDLAALLGEDVQGVDYSYTPVIAVFGTALLMAIVLGDSMIQHFMGFSICALAMLKLMDVESFANSFVKYDLLTQHLPIWGKLFPGVELLIGLGFLFEPPLLIAGWVAFIVGVQGMVSVVKAVYIDKLALNCACVGGNTKTPLGIVSFTEYAIQSVMGFLVAFQLAF
jgi:glutaredoxin